MGIRYVWPVVGEIYPQIWCDVCSEPIHDLSDGNIVWTPPPDAWPDKSEWATDQVFFAHKKCDRILRHALQQQGIQSTYWEELRLFPIHLMYNANMRPSAKAAFDIRVPVMGAAQTRTPESLQRSGLALRFAILKRDKYRCQLCGRSAQDGVVLEVDHKVAWSKGGPDTPANLWTLCFDCNRGKSDEDL